MYTVECIENFTLNHTVTKEGEITYIDITAKAVDGPGKLSLAVKWNYPLIGAHLSWSPIPYAVRGVTPTWGVDKTESYAMRSAPVRSYVAYDDTNGITVACSDAKNNVCIQMGLRESCACLACGVFIRVDCDITEYSARIRIDERKIPFSECIEDVAKWWETFDGYTPAPVPEAARKPLYSTWYSYHQGITPDALLRECQYFHSLGCDTIIVDDGWHTAVKGGVYSTCGDWVPSAEKFPDMREFVNQVHKIGMKIMLWYTVPFMGENTMCYEQFKDKMLKPYGNHRTWILDPRYPEVREYIIGKYRSALMDWGIDGLKLDFIDSFAQSDTVKDGMDFVSVYDAVDRLMKDVLRELRAVRPDVLIEFRQTYIGPLMRTFGNMFRSSDTPNDSFGNRLNVLHLRQMSGNTAVHSDMTMWHPGESVESAAFQLTSVLFSVPQISVRESGIPEEHKAMIKEYLSFWNRYRQVILDGKMTYKNFASNYTYVSARLGDTQVGAVYGGRVAYLDVATEEIVLVNATMEKTMWLDARFRGEYSCVVKDCMGRECGTYEVVLGEPARIPVPVNGYVYMMRK